jgi:hypothetical protein
MAEMRNACRNYAGNMNVTTLRDSNMEGRIIFKWASNK